MESQPQNPDFRINPENFHPCRNFFQESEKMRKKSVSAFKMECNNNRKQSYVHYFSYLFSLLSSRQIST